MEGSHCLPEPIFTFFRNSFLASLFINLTKLFCSIPISCFTISWHTYLITFYLVVELDFLYSFHFFFSFLFIYLFLVVFVIH